ncbi:MAG TPA: O-antigen ligase family protein [Geminicoccaceae bacterium]|nr:O-antigen ligase family protein [Geminicoccaceae bacterium]
MRPVAAILLGLLTCFAFLSSTLTDALGLQAWRMGLFSGLVALLLVAALAAAPRVPVRHGAEGLWLLLLASLILLVDLPGGIDPVEYKIVLPVLVLLLGPRLALLCRGLDVPRLIWALLSLYVLLAVALHLLMGEDLLLRGEGEVLRWDVSGSVVTHGSLCAVHGLLAVAVVRSERSLAPRLVAAMLGTAATLMAFLAGTRTIVAILVLYAVLWVASAADRRRAARAATALVALVALVFALHTLLVSDAFLQRLSGAGDDYSSGRWSSIRHWLALAADAPMGLGLGAVRTMLAHGRPALDGERLLEWPHNEPVRFWIEAGPLGLLFVLGLIGTLLRTAWRAATACPDPLGRVLALALAADILAQSLLQNFFNSVYQATLFALILVVLVPRPEPLPAAAVRRLTREGAPG